MTTDLDAIIKAAMAHDEEESIRRVETKPNGTGLGMRLECRLGLERARFTKRQHDALCLVHGLGRLGDVDSRRTFFEAQSDALARFDARVVDVLKRSAE
jgi:hypothetical protein